MAKGKPRHRDMRVTVVSPYGLVKEDVSMSVAKVLVAQRGWVIKK